MIRNSLLVGIAACGLVALGSAIWFIDRTERTAQDTQNPQSLAEEQPGSEVYPVSADRRESSLQPDKTGEFTAQVRVITQEADEGSGSIIVLLEEATKGQYKKIECINGSWSGSLPISQYEVVAVYDGAARYAFTASNTLTVVSPQITITASIDISWILEVVDRASGGHLNELRLVRLSPTGGHSNSEYGSPSGGTIVVDNGKSPLELTDQSGDYWVEVPGFIGQYFSHNGHQRLVRLTVDKAASVEINVIDTGIGAFIPGRDRRTGVALLRARSEGHEDWARTVNGGEKIGLGSFPEGVYNFEARYKSPLGIGEVLWGETIPVVSGPEPTRINVLLGSPRVYGTINVSVFTSPNQDTVGWELSAHRRTVTGGWELKGSDPIANWTHDAQSGVYFQTYRFAEPGETLLQLVPCGLEQRFVVTRNMTQDIALDASATATLSVRVVNQVEDPIGTYIAWSYIDKLESRPQQRQVVADRNGVEINCLPYPVAVFAFSSTSMSPVKVVTPTVQQTQEVLLTLESGLIPLKKITILEHGSEAHVSDAFWTQLTAQPDGSSGTLLRKLFGTEDATIKRGDGLVVPNWSQCVLQFSQPGTYVLRHPRFQERAIEVGDEMSEAYIALQ